MKTINGDLIQLAKSGEFDVIVHGCNCFCTMGAGIAKTIKSEFPEAFDADCQTLKGDQSKLGTFSKAFIETNNSALVVVNAYTQFNWRGNGKKVDYLALRKVFQEIGREFSGKKIGYPMIGAGLAGGDWSHISAIIAQELKGEDHTLVVFGRTSE